MSSNEFRSWEHKAITFLGMSGVGKTRLARLLRQRHWFHYSVDYRIGTRYLNEPIMDNIKYKAMEIPFLRDLLRSDSIYIANNITVDNLKSLSTYLGKVGNPERDGLGMDEFKHRQRLHRNAEIAALKDVPEYIRKAREIYGYSHFVNDAGGSLCELDDVEVFDILSQHTLILYIQSTTRSEQELIRRAEEDPKPLYFRESFLDDQLAVFMQERSLEYAAMINPDDFVRWVFPRLLHARLPRYEAIASKFGYTVTTDDISGIRDDADFLDLIAGVLDRQNTH
ncbi:MAG: ATPase [Gammaproteobacteria bacterium RIFCSPLOWO2_02_FULL_56_15]|nr:MAG: ATPase [Gammaproteobacteria bacterium RIFCSPLOWO2_02_FULL_56_15]